MIVRLETTMLWWALFLPLTVTAVMDGVVEESLQSSWISISPTEEFQPVETSDPKLRQAQRRFLGYTDNFIDGDTYYDEYSTAWRVLGWYIDCSAANDQQRALEENSGYCARYILWAAYADLDYKGGGIGEYQFYNEEKKEWDKTTCELMNNQRCAKMDCHLSTTHFKLLGFFKQYDYDDFMEQLFKHQAYCLWTYDDYSFMNTYRNWWPEGCQSTGKTDNNNYVYMDIKPEANGRITLGLYSDSACSTPYTGNKVQAKNVVSSYYGSSLSQHIDYWNKNFAIFTKCQPCKAYSLSTSQDNGDNQEGGDQNQDNDPNDGNFVCDDAAGYTNVNQCMKFGTHTNMKVASYNDVALASRQGTVQRSYMAEVRPSFLAAWGFFILSAVLFVLGCLAFSWSARPPRVIRSRRASEPLMRKF